MEHAVYSVGVTTYRDLIGKLGPNHRHLFLPARWKQEQGHKSQIEQAPVRGVRTCYKCVMHI
jgi:hypothetical protein